MKILTTILFILFFHISAVSQMITKKDESHKFEAGFHTNFSMVDYKDPDTFDKSYLIFWGTEPFIGFYPVKNLGFGIIASYSFVKSSFISLPPLYSAGVYVRYYIPFKINRKILNNIDFFLEANYNKTNYLYSENQPLHVTDVFDVSYPFIYNKLNQTNINIPAGINFKIVKKLHIEISYQYIIFLQGSNKIGARLGLNYYFFNNKKHSNNIKKQ
ncbi:MAG: hypothetical protein K8R54_00050 [Bacteroidales bacterium]|nr:hypothetical protein [Bacteroidales bacterium]